MRLFFRLLGMQINQRMGFSAMRAMFRENKARAIGRLCIGALVGISLLSIVAMYVWFLVSFMPAFQTLGMEQLLLGLVLLVSMVMVFFLGMFYLIGVLFFSKDTEFLASLPIPQRTVFAAKFGQVLLGEIGSSAIILLPAFIVYGVMTGAGIGFWLSAIPVLLLVPCIPLALSGLLSTLLMRFSVLWRRRELFTIIGSILLMVFLMGGQMLLTSRIPQDMNAGAILALLTDNSGLLNRILSVFPPSSWAAEGLLGNVGQLALFAAVSCIALAMVVGLAGRLYYGGAMAQLETASKQRAVRLTGRSLRRRSMVLSLFLREWRTVLRSPVYALNGLMVIIMGPLILLIPLLFGGSAGSDPELSQLISLLQSTVDVRVVLLLLAALFMFMAMINPAATTSISREGKNFYLMRIIPVAPAWQILAKFLFGLSVSALAMLFMGVSSSLVLNIPPVVALLAFALGLLASIAPLSLSMIPDVVRPKLSWNSETEAIKQNVNSMLGMAIGWLYMIAIGFGCVKAIQAGMDTGMVLGVVIGAVALFGAAGFYGLCRAANAGLRRIEG